MGNKNKGMGPTLNNSITLPQRFALLKWVEARKGDERIYRELAVVASADLGFVVTENVMQNHWITVHGRRNKRHEKIDLMATARDIEARMIEVERKLERLALFVGGDVKI